MPGDAPGVMLWLRDAANHSSRTKYGSGIQWLAFTLCFNAICVETSNSFYMFFSFKAEGRERISNSVLWSFQC